MTRLLVSTTLLALLGACSTVQSAAIKGGLATADRGAIEAADNTAAVLVRAPCAMTAGAYFRLGGDMRRAVAMLCGGAPDDQVDLDTLRALKALVDE